MTTRTIYIAKDGEEFFTEQECLDYENKLNNVLFKYSALLFDAEGNQLPLCEESIKYCSFVVCKNKIAAQFLHQKFHGLDPIWWNHEEDAGAWVFNRNNWESLEKFLAFADIAKKIAKL